MPGALVQIIVDGILVSLGRKLLFTSWPRFRLNASCDDLRGLVGLVRRAIAFGDAPLFLRRRRHWLRFRKGAQFFGQRAFAVEHSLIISP